MKYNKGFASVVILLIVLGVLAVGGVAYFVGKSSAPKNEVADNSNYFPLTEQNYTPPTTSNNPPAQTPPPANNPPQQQNTQTQQPTQWNNVNIKGVSVPYPSTWQIRNPIGFGNCQTITCETSAAMRGDLDYKIYDPNITSNFIYVSARSDESGDCTTAALPCPLSSYSNVKTTQIKGLVIQTNSTDVQVISIYNQIISKIKIAYSSQISSFSNPKISFDYPSTKSVVYDQASSSINIYPSINTNSSSPHVTINLLKKCSDNLNLITDASSTTLCLGFDGGFLTNYAVANNGADGYIVTSLGLSSSGSGGIMSIFNSLTNMKVMP